MTSVLLSHAELQRLVSYDPATGEMRALSNLRLATRSQNSANAKRSARNTTGFKGVSRAKRPGAFRATIRRNQVNVSLGVFSTPEEAHEAYVKAAAEAFGEFARAA